MHKSRITKQYIALYTLFFLALSAAVFLPFVLAGKSLIGNGDGQSQYILQLDYMGKWLRSAVRGLLHGSFSPKRYDLTIGLGDDINAVVRFHPLDFLSVFVPESGTEALYHVLIFLRLYLAGLTFSLYAFAWRKQTASDASAWGILAGSLVYLFAGYTFCLGIVHPTYLSPLITLPLLFLGAERMLLDPEKHRFVLFSVICALSFISNYYFMFIASVAVFLYVLVRFFQVVQGQRLRRFFVTFVRFVLAYALGVLLAGITLMPALTRYGQSYRSERLSSAGSLWVYADKRRYAAWILNLISPLRASGNGTHLNFAVLVLPALALLFACRKSADSGSARRLERSFLRTAALVLLGFLLIPAGGYVMAALSTENNRWVFLIALFCAGAVSFTFPDLQKACRGEKKQLRVILAVCAGYDLAAAISSVWIGADLYNLAGALELTLATAGIFLSALHHKKRAGAGTPAGEKRGGPWTLMGILTSSIVLNGVLTFGSAFGNLPQYYMPWGTSLSWYRESVYASYPEADEDALCRSDGVFSGNTEDNAALLLKYNGIQMYNSVLNASEIEALLSTGNIGLTTMLHVTGLDGRPAAEALAGVRWFLADEENRSAVPFGWQRVGSGTRKGTSLYENPNPLGLSCSAQRVMPRSEYELLTDVEKEWALLDVSVVEDAKLSLCPGEVINADAWRQTASVEQREAASVLWTEGIEKQESEQGSIYRVSKKKARLQVSYQRRRDAVCYVTFHSLKPSEASKMKVRADGISKQITLLTPSETYTLRREDYTVCLGVGENNADDTLLLSFNQKGDYALEKITFSYVPTGDFEQKLITLSDSSDVSLHLTANRLRASVVRDLPGIQVFALPYSTGWSAQANGQEVPVLRTNLWEIGVVLPEGASEVVLTYRTPGRRVGAIMTVAGLLLLVCGATLIARLRKSKNKATING